MKCPVCPATDLLMTAREGIEIDYCPNCRGVWLDRGELDHLIRRDEQVSVQQAQPYPRDRDRHQHYRHDDHHYGDSKGRHGYPRRKKSFLGELFDFD
ncbi:MULTISPECIES: TFIIB-type zinc ribbon-containing protein [Caballeronia]|uniref:Transcription factor zinc-finger domain-containing protein n=1 Tax=Caballeronia concitans TaxID=1777133 RepID=A0A658QY85_9BURK|nr:MULTISPECIES: zf-TFIIB domain-containing protein [Caballeronia]KIG11367.1 hypothetical protein BurMR1_1648 [Burkholderia sp. MR1]SAL32637.1 hypothetical protein AWB72_02952 [Caballeronia concitans]